MTAVTAPVATRPAPAFVTGLRRHGARTALIDATGSLSYDELADRIDAAARALAGARRLVLVTASASVASLVGYLAALQAGHVVLLAPAGDPTTTQRLERAWTPDVVVDAEGSVVELRSESGHGLHPDLALLLATSGSTGSPRLVRLSHTSLDANAAAIAEVLDIRPTDRAVTTLPLHYCYGLSVVHSNLHAGAALVLTDASVTDDAFWATVREQRATSLHGVPHSFALLDRVGFAEMDLPHLRYVTQAGGRLAPDRVRRWADVARRGGWRLVVMYGQTEATARMAHLPPHLAAEAPDAVGIPVPGGELRVDDPDADGVGEIVYRGPNVMLGYARTPADLALGRSVTELRTGDLGLRGPDGLWRVTGRRSRFVKPFGVRVDLDAVEALLAAEGLTAAVTGDDTRLVVALECSADGADVSARARGIVTGRLHLPDAAVAVVGVAQLPRRANGKLDHPAVAALVPPTSDPTPDPTTSYPPDAASSWRSPIARVRRRLSSRRPTTVRDVFARTFPSRHLDDEATFVDLGGDSLTYVAVSTDLERVLGHLPVGWDQRPLGELASSVRGERRRSPWSRLETVLVLRAAAILLVVGEHDHLWTWLGGAHLLLAIAGWTFARFVLHPHDVPAPADYAKRATGALPARILRSAALPARILRSAALPARILRSAALIAVPSSLWILLRTTMTPSVHAADALLLGSLFHPLVQGYWFVDTLVQVLVGAAALLAVPAIRRAERRHPFGMPATALAMSLPLVLVPGDPRVSADLYSTHRVLWLFLLGWMLQRASTSRQRLVAALAVLAVVPLFFALPIERTAIVGVGLLVLLFTDRVLVPRALVAPLTAVAGASLAIYLTHFALLSLAAGLPAGLLVIIDLLVGIVVWHVAVRLVRLGVHGAHAVAESRRSARRSRPQRGVDVLARTSAIRLVTARGAGADCCRTIHGTRRALASRRRRSSARTGPTRPRGVAGHPALVVALLASTGITVIAGREALATGGRAWGAVLLGVALTGFALAAFAP